MSIEINQTPQKSSLNIFQFPNIKSQSVSNLTENKTHKIGSQQAEYKKSPSQPVISETKNRLKYRSEYVQQPIKKSVFELNINGNTIPDQIKVSAPRATKIIENYNTVDLWKSKYAFFVTKPYESKSKEPSFEDEIEQKKNEDEIKGKLTKQKIMQKILKNSPNTRYEFNKQIFNKEFQIQKVPYTKKEKGKSPDVKISKLKEKTTMIFSKYKKFSTTHTTNNISNDKTSEKIKNNFLKESIIPTSWEIRNSIKEDEDFFGYDISRSKNK